MPLASRRILATLLALAVACPTLVADEPLKRTDIVKLAKPATALVEVKPGYGSAFCVHSSGLFVTNEHVVRSGGAISVILDPGLKTQQVLKAKVLRKDKDL